MFKYSIQVSWPSAYEKSAFSYEVEHIVSPIELSKSQLLNSIKNPKIKKEIEFSLPFTKIGIGKRNNITCESDDHYCGIIIEEIDV